MNWLRAWAHLLLEVHSAWQRSLERYFRLSNGSPRGMAMQIRPVQGSGLQLQWSFSCRTDSPVDESFGAVRIFHVHVYLQEVRMLILQFR